MTTKALKDLTDAEQKALAQKFARLIQHDGWSSAEVARRHNLPEHMPRYLMRKHGFGNVRPARARGEPPRFLRNDPHGRTPDDVLRLRRMGWTWTALGIEFGVGADSIWQTMKRWCLANGREWPVRPVKEAEDG